MHSIYRVFVPKSGNGFAVVKNTTNFQVFVRDVYWYSVLCANNGGGGRRGETINKYTYIIYIYIYKSVRVKLKRRESQIPRRSGNNKSPRDRTDVRARDMCLDCFCAGVYTYTKYIIL